MISKTKKIFSNATWGAILFIVLAILGLFITPSIVLAIESWTNDFDNYTEGEFKGQDFYWYVRASSSVYIVGGNYPYYHSFPLSMEFSPAAEINWRQIVSVIDTDSSSSSFKFYYMVSDPPNSPSAGNIYFVSTDKGYIGCIYLSYVFSLSGSNSYIEFSYTKFNSTGFPIIKKTVIPTGWHSIEVQWNLTGTSTGQMRFKADELAWTNWEEVYEPTCEVIDELIIADSNSYYSDDYRIYWDSFYQGQSYGTCGINLSCVYCLDKSSCENNGCFWIEGLWEETGYGSQCVPTESKIEEVASTALDACNFYASNSEWATGTYNDCYNSTGIYLSLTKATGGLLNILSSWLSHFSGLFDLTQAQQKGIEMGQTLPKMRGYLVFFNSFFSDFPLGEICLLYFIVLIAIIIFRFIRQAKSLLPFQ